MKTKIYLIIAALFLSFIAAIWIQTDRLNAAKADRDVYKGNNNVLLSDSYKYKTKDSLNAISVGELQLKLSEFQKYRNADLALINSLQVKNRDLNQVIKLQPQTIIHIKGHVRDSIQYINNTILDTLKCFDITNKWYELHGCINNNKFDGTFINIDSLVLAETIKYKRFLGFLWKTKKVKDRKIDIVSKNPNTKILGVEYINIRE